jgi:hypothetical protein
MCYRHNPDSESAFFDSTLPVSAHLQSGRQVIIELGLYYLVDMHREENESHKQAAARFVTECGVQELSQKSLSLVPTIVCKVHSHSSPLTVLQKDSILAQHRKIRGCLILWATASIATTNLPRRNLEPSLGMNSCCLHLGKFQARGTRKGKSYPISQ